MKRSTTAANASLISHRSMSSVDMRASFSALRLAAAGPVSMMVGSLPIEANERIRARGCRPSLRPALRLPTSTAAAPSTMPLELPAVCT